MPKPKPATTRRQKRPKNCTFCRNHSIIASKTGHHCKFRQCQCLLCQLTAKSQVVMKYQQALWRHQSRILAEHIDPLMRRLAKKRSQLCDKCRNHNIFCEKRGHKTKCEHENCKCVLCQLTDKRRLIMKYQQRVRRANVTAEEINASEDESDTEQPEANSERDLVPDTSPDSPMNVGHGVTELLDSISVMLDDFSRQFPTLRRAATPPVDDAPKSPEPTPRCPSPVQPTSTHLLGAHPRVAHPDESGPHAPHPPFNASPRPSYGHLPACRPRDANVNIDMANGIFSGVRREQVRETFRGDCFPELPIKVEDHWTARMMHHPAPFLQPPPVPHTHHFHQLGGVSPLPPPFYPPPFHASHAFPAPPQPAEKLFLCRDSSYHVWKRQYHNRNIARFCESVMRKNASFAVDARCHWDYNP